MSVRSAPQILSLNGSYIFGFSSFLITGLCCSLGNRWFGIISLLTTDLSRVVKVSDREHVKGLLEEILQKNL